MITLNGTNLSAIGFVAQVRHLPRLHGEQARTMNIPGRIGGVRAGGQAPNEMLTIDATIVAADHATLLANMDSLAALCRGDVVIRINDITDREWVGTLDASSQFNPSAISWIAEYEPLTLAFNCADPTARAQAATTVAGLNPDIPLGISPSPLNVSVQNGSGAGITAVSIAVRSGSDELRVLEWSGSVPSSGLLEIVADPSFSITVDGANAIDGLTDVSDFPIADPFEAADNILITVTGGTGVTASTTYRKRW